MAQLREPRACIEPSGLGEDAMQMDRKVLVALVALKLWKFLEEFASEHEHAIKLVLDTDAKTFRGYLLDVLVEACQLIRDNKGVK